MSEKRPRHYAEEMMNQFRPQFKEWIQGNVPDGYRKAVALVFANSVYDAAHKVKHERK